MRQIQNFNGTLMKKDIILMLYINYSIYFPYLFFYSRQQTTPVSISFSKYENAYTAPL